MPKYNFEVVQSVRFFIQRDCADDDAALEMVESLEAEGAVDLSEQMRHTDMEYEYDLEVVGHAEHMGTE